MELEVNQPRSAKVGGSTTGVFRSINAHFGSSNPVLASFYSR
jgi:hypothetical protein